MEPALQRAAPGILDFGRCCRPADHAAITAVRGDALRPDQPRYPLYSPSYAAAVFMARPALCIQQYFPSAAADGAALPSEGQLRYLGLLAQHAGDSAGDEEVRHHPVG